MGAKVKKLGVTLLVIIFLLIGAVAMTGCKKKVSTEPAESKQAVSESILQTSCPVMAGPIDKNIYTTYKGKKVYFCMQSCKEAFEKEPEKYVSGLPQFKD